MEPQNLCLPHVPFGGVQVQLETQGKAEAKIVGKEEESPWKQPCLKLECRGSSTEGESASRHEAPRVALNLEDKTMAPNSVWRRKFTQ